MRIYIENAKVIDIVGISSGDCGQEVILEILLSSKKKKSFARLLLNEEWSPQCVKYLSGSILDVITCGPGICEYSLVLPFRNQSDKRKLQINIGRLSAVDSAEWLQNLPFIDLDKTPFKPHPMASKLDDILVLSVDRELCPPSEYFDENQSTLH